MAVIKPQYNTSQPITITLASLATSATRVDGRESTYIDNTSTKYLDVLVSGKVTAGTSPTAGKQIDVWVVASEDGSTFPSVFDGTDSAAAIPSENVRNSALRLAATAIVDSTSDRTYFFAPFSIAALYGGNMPRRWSVFVTHDTVVNLNATGSNHAWSYTGYYAESV